MPHQDAVFADERHHVRHGGQRDVVEQMHRQRGEPSTGTRACTSLKAMPVPHSIPSPRRSSARWGSMTAVAGGGSAPGRW